MGGKNLYYAKKKAYNAYVSLVVGSCVSWPNKDLPIYRIQGFGVNAQLPPTQNKYMKNIYTLHESRIIHEPWNARRLGP